MVNLGFFKMMNFGNLNDGFWSRQPFPAGPGARSRAVAERRLLWRMNTLQQSYLTRSALPPQNIDKFTPAPA